MEVGSTAYEKTINALDLLDAQRFQTEQEEARKRIALEQSVQDSKVQMSMDTVSALNDLVQAFAGENEKSQKRAFMINKVAGIANTLSAPHKVSLKHLQRLLTLHLHNPLDLPMQRLWNATGAAQIATIARQQFQASGSVDSNIPQRGTAPSTSPQFNVVGGSGTNALIESLQANPMRAYVVGSDVTSQQELDRNRINQVSFP